MKHIGMVSDYYNSDPDRFVFREIRGKCTFQTQNGGKMTLEFLILRKSKADSQQSKVWLDASWDGIYSL